MIELKNRTNIKDLAVAEPKPLEGFPYDLDSCLTDEEWSGIKYDITWPLNFNNDFSDSVFLASRALIAFPKRREELPFRSFMELLPRTNTRSIIHLRKVKSADVKILFPSDMDTLYSNLSVRQDMIPNPTFLRQVLEASVYGKEDESISSVVFQAAMLYPKNLDEIKNVENLKLYLTQRLEEDRKNDDYSNFARDGALLKLLYGKDMPKITEKDWLSLKNTYGAVKSTMAPWDRKSFLQFAANIAILAADEVKMTEDGLQLTHPQPQERFGAVREIPERRKF